VLHALGHRGPRPGSLELLLGAASFWPTVQSTQRDDFGRVALLRQLAAGKRSHMLIDQPQRGGGFASA